MMSDRAFVFDMDGVLVPSEKAWEDTEPGLLVELFGRDIASQIGDTVGATIASIYKRAKKLGASVDKQIFYRKYHDEAMRVYDRCRISRGVDDLVSHLLGLDFRIAILSSSPMAWIDHVVGRLSWKDALSAIISLDDHRSLRAKPAPDGYVHAIGLLGADARKSIALEDSNPGIRAAKAAGLFAIGYREHLPGGYQQQGADAYADTMNDVRELIRKGRAS